MIQLKTRDNTISPIDLPIDEPTAHLLAACLNDNSFLVRLEEHEIGGPPKPQRQKGVRQAKEEAEQEPKAKEAKLQVTGDVMTSVCAAIEALGGSARFARISDFLDEVDDKLVKRALTQLVANGRVVTHGKARGTTYRVAG